MSRQFIPNAASEIGSPVGGQTSILRCVHNIEVLSIGSIRVFTGFLKPLMFVRAMVDYQIHEKIHVPLAGFCNKLFHLFHGSEPGVNVIIIRNIVPLICQRRAVNRRNPDNIHSQLLQIIQFTDNPSQISYPISIGIQETFGINLICYLIMPPRFFHTPFLVLSNQSIY